MRKTNETTTTPTARYSAIGCRVQIPAYYDAWMQGDRYGEIVRTSRGKLGSTICHVRMDRSGKVRKFEMSDLMYNGEFL